MPPPPPRLTVLAQRAVARVLRPGDWAIDATMGNGHDTLFLWNHVQDSGHVVAFDVQARALYQTQQRFKDACPSVSLVTIDYHDNYVVQNDNPPSGVTLIHDGHENLAQRLSASWHGQAAAIMFNLGYLPGHDDFNGDTRQRITTRPQTTLAALHQAANLFLRPQGSSIITVIVYPGHQGGADEAAAVGEWVSTQLPSQFTVDRQDSRGPLLYLLQRK